MRSLVHFVLTLFTAAALSLPFAAVADARQVGSNSVDVSHISVHDLPKILASDEVNYISVINALDEAGYEILSVTDTWLNRVRIRARNRFHLREIVISRASGHILRDGLIEIYDEPKKSIGSAPPPVSELLKNTDEGIYVLP